MTDSADTQIKTILTADSGDFEAGVKRASAALSQAEGKFKSSTKNMTSSFQGFSQAVEKGLAELGIAFGVAEIINYSKELIELGAHLNDLSKQTGIAATTISALRAPLEASGSSIDEFSADVVKMNKNISEAATGQNNNLLKAFTDLGLSVTKLRTMSPQDQLQNITTALAKIKDQGDFTRLGTDTLGKSFAGLAPIIKETGGNLNDYATNAQKAGNALSQSDIDRLAKLGTAIAEMGVEIENFGIHRLLDVVTALQAISTVIAEIGIEVGALTGLINRDVANSAIDDAEAKLKALNKAKDDLATPSKSPSAAGNNNDILTQDQINKAKQLKLGLDDLQRTGRLEIANTGATDLEKNLNDVDAAVKKLTARYGPLTEAQQKQVDTIKDDQRNLDQWKKQIQFADDLGNAFEDAFSKMIEGGAKFSDVMNSLLTDIEKLLVKALILQPIEDQFSSGRPLINPQGVFGGPQGATGGVVSAIEDFLPSFSFATGISNVPYDMTAKIHKGETVMTKQATDALANGSGGGLAVTINNNTPATVKTQQQSNGSLEVVIDQVTAKNAARAGSKTNQAIRAQGARTLVRR